MWDFSGIESGPPLVPTKPIQSDVQVISRCKERMALVFFSVTHWSWSLGDEKGLGTHLEMCWIINIGLFENFATIYQQIIITGRKVWEFPSIVESCLEEAEPHIFERRTALGKYERKWAQLSTNVCGHLRSWPLQITERKWAQLFALVRLNYSMNTYAPLKTRH